MALKKDFFMALKPAVKKVEIDGWPEPVYIRKWTGADRAKFLEKTISTESGNPEIKADNFYTEAMNMVLFSLSDEEGKRVFEDNELEIVMQIEATTLDKLVDEITKFNGLGEDNTKAAVKNSGTIQR